MGLLEDLQNEGNFPKATRATCSVCNLIKSLPEKESKILQARMTDTNIGHTALCRVLRANQINISDSVMGRHRRGVCSGGTRK